MDTRSGLDWGLSRNFNSKAFNITRTEVSTNVKIDIKSHVNTDTTTISAIIFTSLRTTSFPGKCTLLSLMVEWSLVSFLGKISIPLD